MTKPTYEVTPGVTVRYAPSVPHGTERLYDDHPDAAKEDRDFGTKLFETRAEALAAKASGVKGARYIGTPCGKCGNQVWHASGHCVVCEKVRQSSPAYRAHNRTITRKLYAENAEAIKAKERDKYQTPGGRAYGLLKGARKRERAKGVPEEHTIDVEAALPYIIDALVNGPWKFDLRKVGKRGNGPLSPSLSRCDHRNDRYSAGFWVEPWCVNRCRRKDGSLPEFTLSPSGALHEMRDSIATQEAIVMDDILAARRETKA